LLEQLGRDLDQDFTLSESYIAVIHLPALDDHRAAIGGVDGRARPVEAASGYDLHAALLSSRGSCIG
jgi:hypothetical protein